MSPADPSPLDHARPEDRDHLRLLAAFHYVVALLAALVSCLFLVHFGFGALLTFAPEKLGEGPPPQFVGCLVMAIGAVAVLLGWSFAGAMFYAGRCLSSARRYTFCLVVAAISCVFAPIGTVLGVLTLLVLLRPSVKHLFGVGPEPAPPGSTEPPPPPIAT